MARSNSYSRNAWTPDHKAQRARKGAETKAARKNERRDIQNHMQGVTYDSYGEHQDEQELNSNF